MLYLFIMIFLFSLLFPALGLAFIIFIFYLVFKNFFNLGDDLSRREKKFYEDISKIAENIQKKK